MSNDGAPVISIQGECSDDDCESDNSATRGQYVKCGVPVCNNYFDGQRQEFIGFSYFPFPEDPDLRTQWIKAIDLPEDTDTSALMICSQHFGNNDIYNLQEVDGKTTTHLKPNAYPCKKLYAFVQNHNADARCFEDGKLIGIRSSLVNTSEDDINAVEGGSSDLLTTAKDALPKITSVSTLALQSNDTRDNGKVELAGTTDPPGRHKPLRTYRTLVKVGKLFEEMDCHSEELISEEMMSSDETDNRAPVPNPEKGLQVIPALVKLPPRLPKIDLVGDSVSVEGNRYGGSVTASRLPKFDLASKMNIINDNGPDEDSISGKPTMSTPSALQVENVPVKRRRARASKEEIRRREEEDEWEPSFWSRKALKKAGFADCLSSDKKRKVNEFKRRSGRAKDSDSEEPTVNQSKHQDEGLEEEDEGWRVVEPIATENREQSGEDSGGGSNNPLSLLEVSMGDGAVGSRENPRKRRPGPASKTCRPMYVPQTNGEGDTEKEHGEGGAEKEHDSGDEGHQLDLSADSLLIDWSFFKSLLPDLRTMDSGKRIEFKSFVLDTLNSALYEGKPITPILNL